MNFLADSNRSGPMGETPVTAFASRALEIPYLALFPSYFLVGKRHRLAIPDRFREEDLWWNLRTGNVFGQGICRNYPPRSQDLTVVGSISVVTKVFTQESRPPRTPGYEGNQDESQPFQKSIRQIHRTLPRGKLLPVGSDGLPGLSERADAT